jgi:N-acetylglucosamine-6-phosphate deacetylase
LANDDNNGNISSTQLFYGLIADGMHVSKAAIQMAFSTNSDGVILVTDCISALGFPNGSHQIGCRIIEINGDKAFIQGTNIMAGR